MSEVTHEVSGQVERSRNATLPDVIFNVRLGLEVRNMLETAVCELADVQQGGEDQVLDPKLLGSVRNVLALIELDFILRAFPVVGHKEDGVGALEGRSDGGFVAQISLLVVNGRSYKFFEASYTLQLDTLLGQGLSRRLRNIASDAANLERFGKGRVGEDVLDD